MFILQQSSFIYKRNFTRYVILTYHFYHTFLIRWYIFLKVTKTAYCLTTNFFNRINEKISKERSEEIKIYLPLVWNFIHFHFYNKKIWKNLFYTIVCHFTDLVDAKSHWINFMNQWASFQLTRCWYVRTIRVESSN